MSQHATLWTKLCLTLSSLGFAIASVATLTIELIGPGTLTWSLPLVGIAFGLILGSGAFLTLSRHQRQRSAFLATSSFLLSLATILVGVVAIIGLAAAIARGALPHGYAVVASAITTLGFLLAAATVAAGAWRASELSRGVSTWLLIAVALKLLAPIWVLAGQPAIAFMVAALLAAWAVALFLWSRSIPTLLHSRPQLAG